MLKLDKTALVIVDVQGKLAQVMDEKQALFDNLQKMIGGSRVLGMPILWVEQLPDKLGMTIPEISRILSEQAPIVKSTFSCCRNDHFLEALKATNCKQVLVVGIEAHVCVYQTVMDLVDLDYEVEVVEDAISSRTIANKQTALQKMRAAGVGVTSTEMALFELLEVAEGGKFIEILKIVK